MIIAVPALEPPYQGVFVAGTAEVPVVAPELPSETVRHRLHRPSV